MINLFISNLPWLNLSVKHCFSEAHSNYKHIKVKKKTTAQFEQVHPKAAQTKSANQKHIIVNTKNAKRNLVHLSSLRLTKSLDRSYYSKSFVVFVTYSFRVRSNFPRIWFRDLSIRFWGIEIQAIESTHFRVPKVFFFHYYLAASTTNWAHNFTGLL